MAKSLTGPKGTAWKRFSEWIRVRDCLTTTGLPFVGVCITCGKRFHIRSLQAGHCFGGRGNAGLFHEDLTNAQCVICNETHHGKPEKYKQIMEDRYGEEQVAKWLAETKKAIPNHDMDFPAIGVKYKAKTDELLKPHGFDNYRQMLKMKEE